MRAYTIVHLGNWADEFGWTLTTTNTSLDGRLKVFLNRPGHQVTVYLARDEKVRAAVHRRGPAPATTKNSTWITGGQRGIRAVLKEAQ